MNTSSLFSYFDQYIPLETREKDELSKFIIERNIRRRQFILQENDVCHHFTFIVSGLFKMYTFDKSGKEHNLQFAAENEWICDIGSFHSKKPSMVYIEAMEPSVIMQIEKSDLMYLFANFPKFDRIFRVIIENKFIKLEHRLLQSISSTAEEHYCFFLGQYPDLSNRLPNTQIASYLGITPEFLSKIRNNLSKKEG